MVVVGGRVQGDIPVDVADVVTSRFGAQPGRTAIFRP
jgi:hypothetical protein